MPLPAQWMRRRPCPSVSHFLYQCPRAQLSACCFESSCWLGLPSSSLLAPFTRNLKSPPPNAPSLTPSTANVPRKACRLSSGTLPSHPLHANMQLAWHSATSYRINCRVNRRFRIAPPRQVHASRLSPKILLWLRTRQPFIRHGCNHRIIAKTFLTRDSTRLVSE